MLNDRHVLKCLAWKSILKIQTFYIKIYFGRVRDAMYKPFPYRATLENGRLERQAQGAEFQVLSSTLESSGVFEI